MNDKEFAQLLARYDKRINKLYDSLIRELSAEGLKTDLKKDELFSFSNHPELSPRVQSIIDKYASVLQSYIIEDIKKSINASFSANTPEIMALISYNSKMVNQWREDAVDAFISSRMSSKDGLSLSDRVWNYTSQMKTEFEAAMSEKLTEGIRKGTSAEELGRQLRPMLNNPDMMYRRYHLRSQETGKNIVEWRKRIINEEGKTRFIKVPMDAVGTGVYRSARQNALRLAATEINMAYRSADCYRWSRLPFVTGIHIELSGNHPVEDICDELQGDYPKWFDWTGWHPRCRCSATSILVGKDEMNEISKLPEAEYLAYKPKNLIKNMPDNFKKWVEKNKERILRAEENGKSPYFLRDNFKDGRIDNGYRWEDEKPARPVKTEEQKADIQRRWDERHANNRILSAAQKVSSIAKDYPGVETSKLNKLVQSKDYEGIREEIKNVAKNVAWERRNTPDYLNDSVMRQTYGEDAVTALYLNTKRTMSKYDALSDVGKVAKFEYEKDWSLNHKKYSTYKEAAGIYEREASRLKDKIASAENAEKYNDLSSKIKSELPQGDKLSVAVTKAMKEYGIDLSKRSYGYTDTVRSVYELDKIQKISDKIDGVKKIFDYSETSKSTIVKHIVDSINYRLNKNGFSADLNDLISEGNKKITSLIKEAEKRNNKAKTTGIITIEDLKNKMGSKLPKTLQHFDEQSQKYKLKSKLTPEEIKEKETILRQMFDKYDFGMNIKPELIKSVFDTSFKNQFETGTSGGSNFSLNNTTGPIKDTNSRLIASNKMFGNEGKPQFARSEYEKYGNLMDKDIAQSMSNYWSARMYGSVEVRFIKSKVVCTWTKEDSLSLRYSPSLVTDPKLYTMENSRLYASENERYIKSFEIKRNIEETRDVMHSSYIELQYHGNLDMSCVKSITFESKSSLENSLDTKTINGIKAMGIDLNYMDSGKLKSY